MHTHTHPNPHRIHPHTPTHTRTHREYTHTHLHTPAHTENTPTHTYTHPHTQSNSRQNTLTWFVYNVPEEGLVLHQMGDDMTCLLCLKISQSNRKSVSSSTSHSPKRPRSASALWHHPVQPPSAYRRTGPDKGMEPQALKPPHSLRDGTHSITISPAASYHLPYWVPPSPLLSPPSPLLSPTISPTESHHLPYWVLSSKLLLPVPFRQGHQWIQCMLYIAFTHACPPSCTPVTLHLVTVTEPGICM